MPRHDFAQRRQAIRRGHERGCWVYVPAEILSGCGVNPAEHAPFYRTWAGRRGSLLVRFYRDR